MSSSPLPCTKNCCVRSGGSPGVNEIPLLPFCPVCYPPSINYPFSLCSCVLELNSGAMSERGRKGGGVITLRLMKPPSPGEKEMVRKHFPCAPASQHRTDSLLLVPLTIAQGYVGAVHRLLQKYICSLGGRMHKCKGQPGQGRGSGAAASSRPGPEPAFMNGGC